MKDKSNGVTNGERQVREFTSNPHASKGEFGAGAITGYWIVEYKTLPNHSTLYLLIFGNKVIWKLMITSEVNKKGRNITDPALGF